MQTLVVDDEPPACRHLADLLRDLGAVVVGTAGSAAEALALIERAPVDVAFLDIRLPEVDGLALAGLLRRRDVRVVFVTGFPDFALPAFDVGAVDYLLKPVTRDRLGRALARIGAGRGGPAGLSPVDRLCLRDGADRILLPVQDVLYVRRDAAGTTVAMDGRMMRIRDTLHRLEAVLEVHGFFRCHRAYLVNLRRVCRIIPWSRDAQSLLLDDPKETLIPLAKSRIRTLRTHLLWP